MTHHDPMTHLIHRAAEEAVPDDLDLWPAIQTRLRPRRAPLSALRWTGSLTLAVAAALAVIVFAGLLLRRTPDPATNPGYLAAQTGQPTPTLPPTDTPLPDTATPVPDADLDPTVLPLTATPNVISPADLLTATPIPAADDASSAVAIDARDFYDGYFQTTGSLSPLRPETDRYWIESIPQFDMDAVGGGWAIIQAIGSFFVPEIVVTPRDGASWSGRYATNTGTLLLPTSALASSEITVISSHAIRRDQLDADARPLALSGLYDLRIRPAGSVLSLSAGESWDPAFPWAEPLVLRLDGYAGQPVRLSLTVRSEPGDVRSDLALSLPGGRTLMLFNPAQARQITLDFVPEADDQRLLLHLLDMSCAADSPADECLPAVYDGIILTVALTPLDGDPSMPLPAQPALPPGSDPGTPTPIAPPSPVASEMMVITATAVPITGQPTSTLIPTVPPAALEPYEHVVQPGDECLRVLYQYGHTDPAVIRVIVAMNDLPEDCTLPEPGTIILIPRPTATAIPPGASRSSTPTLPPTMNLPEGTVAVTLDPLYYGVSPGALEAERVDVFASYLVIHTPDDEGTLQPRLLAGLTGPLSQDDQPELISQHIIRSAQIVSMDRDGSITLAVTPQEAETLRWLLNARIAVRLERAGQSSRSTRITFSMSRADFYAQGLNLDDVVYIQFPVELEMENGTHTASYLISDALITGTGLISGTYRGRPATPGPNEPQLIEVEVAVSGQDADRLQTALDQGRKITVTTTARD